MQWKFIPKVVKEGFYEGYVLVDFPSYEERSKIVKSMNYDFDQDAGKVPTAKAMELKDKMNKAGLEKIKEVKLKRIECGGEITTVEEVLSHPELTGVIDEISAFVVGGIKLSKNL